ncbi:MAG: hypothetical protein D6731_00215, partial [Planctomycetota bacterium]
MNSSFDLYPIGEAYAELDLVVRQLDDGRLTLADDDSLPDDERVHVSATDEGLRASLRIANVPAMNEAVTRGLEALNQHGPCAFTWRAGEVHAEATLPWSEGGPNFSTAQLKRLYAAVLKERPKGRKIEQVARGAAEWSTLVPARPLAPSVGPSGGAGASAAPAVPPSFLPGAGQRSGEERATVRYGAADAVPGRAEPGAAERRPPQAQGGASARGAAPLVLACLGLLLAGGVGAAWFWLRPSGEPGAVATGG